MFKSGLSPIFRGNWNNGVSCGSQGTNWNNAPLNTNKSGRGTSLVSIRFEYTVY